MALALDGIPTTVIQSTSVTSQAITSPTSSFKFDRIFVSAILNGSKIASIADGLGLTWHNYIQTNGGAGVGNWCEIWYADTGNQTVSAETITLTMAGTATYTTLACWIVSNGGNSAGLTFDSGGPVINTASGGGTILASMTTTTAACMVMGYFREQSTAAPVMQAAWVGSPSICSGVTNSYQAVGYQVESATGTYTPQLSSGITDVNTVITFGVVQAGTVVIPTLVTPRKLWIKGRKSF